MSKCQQSWTRPEKMLLASLFGLLALGPAIYLGFRFIPPVHDLKVPTPVMPSPNGFDDYLAAGQRLRDSDKVVIVYNS